ncbi:Pre-rRNA-processing protein ipi3 [Lecanora helva]
MLTESFVASTLNPEKPSNSTVLGVHIHDLQPLPGLKHSFKKSSTNTNCLAIHPSHIFAAQADKAVVNVYSRERNNQEAIVPFPEKIHSIVLAGESDGAGILVLGTEGGSLILWELATGRQVSTPQHHLQPTTCLAVDINSNFLLSGSADSTIHVWSIQSLLSFSASTSEYGQDAPLSPLRSLSNHRAAITAIVTGHSYSRNNIAVSASKDNTCVVWEYSTGDLLHTFLLATTPLCLALDPADRAVYAGYEDGGIQVMDLYGKSGLTHHLRNPESQSTPTQPPKSSRWSSEVSSSSAILCLQVSYDSTSVLSGHEDGKVYSWDVATGHQGKALADFAAPVTNLRVLKPTGFPEKKMPSVKLHNVIKPRYDSFANGADGKSGLVPPNYTFTAQFTSDLSSHDSASSDLFEEALAHPSFPSSVLDDALSEFSAWHSQAKTASVSSDLAELQARNFALESQLEAAATRQNARDKEEWRRQKDEEIKAKMKKERRLRRIKVEEIARKKEMREKINEEDGDLSSSTDELTENI